MGLCCCFLTEKWGEAVPWTWWREHNKDVQIRSWVWKEQKGALRLGSENVSGGTVLSRATSHKSLVTWVKQGSSIKSACFKNVRFSLIIQHATHVSLITQNPLQTELLHFPDRLVLNVCLPAELSSQKSLFLNSYMRTTFNDGLVAKHHYNILHINYSLKKVWKV